MNEYLQFIAGIGSGAIVSWAITHEYYRKSKVDPEVASADYLLHISIDEAWAILTAPENVHKLDWRSPEIIFGETLQVGVELGTVLHKLFIVEMNAPYDMSWGGNPTVWDTKISLRKHPKGTRIVFTKRFWPLISPWWVVPFDWIYGSGSARDDADWIDKELNRILKSFD